MALDVAAVIPLIGVFKYADDLSYGVKTLFKNGDEVVDGSRRIIKAADSLDDLSKTGRTVWNHMADSLREMAKNVKKADMLDNARYVDNAVDAVSDAGKRLDNVVDAASDVEKRLEDIVESGKTTVIYGSDDIANYQYNMIENPGPLAEIQGNPAKNFYGGRYNVEVLTEDRIYYRGGNSDNALGQWFTAEPPESVVKVRIDTAVKPQWIDPITGELTGESVVDTVYAIKIPKGTTVYTGPVGSQGGAYCGGYNIMQTFIKEPWKLDYQVISKSPLE